MRERERERESARERLIRQRLIKDKATRHLYLLIRAKRRNTANSQGRTLAPALAGRSYIRVLINEWMILIRRGPGAARLDPYQTLLQLMNYNRRRRPGTQGRSTSTTRIQVGRIPLPVPDSFNHWRCSHRSK